MQVEDVEETVESFFESSPKDEASKEEIKNVEDEAPKDETKIVEEAAPKETKYIEEAAPNEETSTPKEETKNVDQPNKWHNTWSTWWSIVDIFNPLDPKSLLYNLFFPFSFLGIFIISFFMGPQVLHSGTTHHVWISFILVIKQFSFL